MVIRIKSFILLLMIHAFQIKSVMSQLEAHWVCDELAMHGSYSPFLYETQVRRDFAKHFKMLLMSTLALLVCGLVLCACPVLLLQCLGVILCLLGSTGVIKLCIRQMLELKAMYKGKATGERA